MKKANNVMSKMSQAAMKAWETRRKNKLAADSSSVRKTSKKEMKEKKKGKTVKEVSNESKQDVGFKADEKREMMSLNGVEAEQLARQTQRYMDRKEVLDETRNGRKEQQTFSIRGSSAGENLGGSIARLQRLKHELHETNRYFLALKLLRAQKNTTIIW